VYADRFCLGREENVPEPFNTGRSKLEINMPARQAIVTALNVTLKDETNTCGFDCEVALSVAVVRAVIVWRAGCARCSPHSLVAVKVGSRLYVEARYANAIMSGNTTHLPPAALQQEFYTGLSSLASFVPLSVPDYFDKWWCTNPPVDTPNWGRTIIALACDMHEGV
jgi:hypothetical protein